MNRALLLVLAFVLTVLLVLAWLTFEVVAWVVKGLDFDWRLSE